MARKQIQRLSKAGAIALIYRERSRIKVYDRANPTIGIGHLLTPKERQTGVILVKDEKGNQLRLTVSAGLNKKQIELLFLQDIETMSRELNAALEVNTTQQQFDALMFFHFNIGPTNFRRSQVRRVLNAGGTSQAVAAAWQSSFTTSGGQRSAELVDRRKDEATFWLTGEYEHLSNRRHERTVLAGF